MQPGSQDAVARILPPRVDAQSPHPHPPVLPFLNAGATLDVVAEWDPDTKSMMHRWYVRAATEAELWTQVAQLKAAMPGVVVEHPLPGSDPGNVGADERAVGVALSPQGDNAISVPIPAPRHQQIMLAALLGERMLRRGERLIVRLHGRAPHPKARRRLDGRRESLRRHRRDDEGTGGSGWLPDDIFLASAAILLIAGLGIYAAWVWLRALSVVELAAVAALAAAFALALILAVRTVWRSEFGLRIRVLRLPDHIVDTKLEGTLVLLWQEVLGVGPADADLRALRDTVRDVAKAWQGRTGSGLQRVAFDPRRGGYPRSRPGRPLLLTEEEAGALHPSPLAVLPSQGTERGRSRLLRPPPQSGDDGIDIGYSDA